MYCLSLLSCPVLLIPSCFVFYICLSLFVYHCLSINLYIYLSVCSSVYLSAYLSRCVFVCCLSIYQTLIYVYITTDKNHIILYYIYIHTLSLFCGSLKLPMIGPSQSRHAAIAKRGVLWESCPKTSKRPPMPQSRVLVVRII